MKTTGSFFVCLHETKRFKVRRGLSGPRGEHAQPASGQAYPKPASQFASAFSVLLMATLSGHCAHKHVQHVQGRKGKKMKARPCISHVTKKNKKVRPFFPPPHAHVARAKQAPSKQRHDIASLAWPRRININVTATPLLAIQCGVGVSLYLCSARIDTNPPPSSRPGSAQCVGRFGHEHTRVRSRMHLPTPIPPCEKKNTRENKRPSKTHARTHTRAHTHPSMNKHPP
jgi:hypothetical protein